MSLGKIGEQKGRYWDPWLEAAHSLSALPYRNADLVTIAIKAREISKEMCTLERKQSRATVQKCHSLVSEKLSNILLLVNGAAKLYPQSEMVERFATETKEIVARFEEEVDKMLRSLE